MGDDHRELAHGLFAAATAMLENAIEAAVAGQSAKLGSRQLADRARQLHAAARDITVIAEAAMIVATSGVLGGRLILRNSTGRRIGTVEPRW